MPSQKRLSVRSIVRVLLAGLLGLLLASGSPINPAAPGAAPAVAASIAAAEPGAVVKEAFDLLMDRFVRPPSSAELLNAAWDAGVMFLRDQGILGLPEQRPSFTGDRAGDWLAFVEGYTRLAALASGTLEPWQLDRATIQAMAGALQSPTTRYVAPEQPGVPQAQVEYGGIGISLHPALIVTDVFPGSPAEAAGVRVGDQLLAVGGQPVDGVPLEELSQRIRGPAGTSLELTLRRNEAREPLVFQVARAEVTVEWLGWQVLERNVGYLRLRAFPPAEALGDFQHAIEGISAANVSGLVLDLRGNRGGSTAMLRSIASRFVRQGPLYQQINRGGQQRTYEADGSYWGREGPIAILVDDRTYAASELLALALREHGVGSVIGTKTAGSASGGNFFALSDGSQLQVTTLTYRSGQGKEFASNGIEPDQTVERDLDQLRAGRDNQLETTLEYVRQLVH